MSGYIENPLRLAQGNDAERGVCHERGPRNELVWKCGPDRRDFKEGSLLADRMERELKVTIRKTKAGWWCVEAEDGRRIVVKRATKAYAIMIEWGGKPKRRKR